MFHLLTLLEMPSYATLASDTAGYISGLFADLDIWAYGIVGLVIGGLFTRKIIGAILGGVKPVLGGSRKGRRGRRR